MDYQIKNGRLVIVLPDRIDSECSEQVENGIRQILLQQPGMPLTLDAEELRYISSSGLRVLMRLLKDGQKDLTVINVCSEVYEIFDVTGMDALMKVEKRMRCVDVADCPVIGEGAFGSVYRLDRDTVVKVYRNGEDSLPIIRDEIDKARQAFISGVPTAIPFDVVNVGDQYGAVMEMIDAQNCNNLLVNGQVGLDALIPRYAAFLKTLHGIEDVTGRLPAARDIYLKNLSDYADCLKKDVYERLRELLESMPEDRHILHGDAQLKNVLVSSGEMMVIDMNLICTGSPVFEFASLFATYVAFNEDDPDDTLKFLGIGKEDAYRLFLGTLVSYLGDPHREALERARLKIRTLGYLRFLTILTLELKDIHSPLKDLQILHASGHLEELSQQVKELTI